MKYDSWQSTVAADERASGNRDEPFERGFARFFAAGYASVDVAVDVVGEAVHEDDRAAIGGAELDVHGVQHAGVDLLDRPEGRSGRRPAGRPGRTGLRLRGTDHAELGGADGQGGGTRGTQRAAAIMVDVGGRVVGVHC
jgi:hypothetical protein